MPQFTRSLGMTRIQATCRANRESQSRAIVEGFTNRHIAYDTIASWGKQKQTFANDLTRHETVT